VNKVRIIITLFATLCLAIFFHFWQTSNNSTPQKNIPNSPLNENEAVNLVKSNFPEFSSYPSENLPPKSIKSHQSPEGWYLQFRQEGSGIPLISAQCFFVNNQRQVRETGKFNANGEVIIDLSITNCQQ
jgi:hypothetical protein